MREDLKLLHLQNLTTGTPGITPAKGSTLAEAATICFTHCNHKPGVKLNVSGDYTEDFSILWDTPTEQMVRAYADLEEATEDGASAIGILVSMSLIGYTVVKRSWKTTGIDYWLGYDSDPLFQNKARLEVSGILIGSSAIINARLKQKLKQTKQSDDSRLPALIIVTEFGTPKSKVKER